MGKCAKWGHSMTNRCTTAQSTKVVRRWAPPAIVTLAATAALTALTAAPPARRAVARICGLARLRADALWLCGEAVRQDVDRDAGDHLADRRRPGRILPSGAVRA